MRTFETGATRDTDGAKIDPDGFLSPLVINRFCEYMAKNRVQKDGTTRASDNWKKGIPLDVYIKSMWRHFLAVWSRHQADDDVGEDDLCALMFNVMGYLHEILYVEEKTVQAADNWDRHGDLMDWKADEVEKDRKEHPEDYCDECGERSPWHWNCSIVGTRGEACSFDNCRLVEKHTHATLRNDHE